MLHSLTSPVRAWPTATATIDAGHGFSDGDLVTITGASPAVRRELRDRQRRRNDVPIHHAVRTGGSATGTIYVRDINQQPPPIQFSGLANGTYTVYVAGENDAGVWQTDAQATASKTWTVNTALAPHVRDQRDPGRQRDGRALRHRAEYHPYPDVAELYNDGRGRWTWPT